MFGKLINNERMRFKILSLLRFKKCNVSIGCREFNSEDEKPKLAQGYRTGLMAKIRVIQGTVKSSLTSESEMFVRLLTALIRLAHRLSRLQF